MGYKSYPTKRWLKWLALHGLVYERTKGSHSIYNHPTKPFDRPIVVREAEKEVPGCHIHTTLKTMKISYEQFQKEIAAL